MRTDPTDRQRGLVLLLGLLLAVAGAGCTSPELQRCYARRGENMQATLDMLAEFEDRRPGQLRSTVDMLEDIHRDDLESHRRNREQTLPGWSRSQMTRWKERGPVLRQDAARLFGGNPGNLEETLPLVLD